MRTASICVAPAIVLTIVACGGDPQLAAELNARLGTGANVPPGATEQPAPGQQPTPGQQPGQGQPNEAGMPVGTEAPGTVGIAPTNPPPGGTAGGAATPPGGTGEMMPTEGTGDPADPGADPYAPRSGSFRMLVYSRTTGYRHDSIAQGKTMLQQIATEQGFEITEVETNELITLEGLSQFEIVFFMNSTGDIFNQTEETAFQTWMETKNGAFAGTHSATDTEQGWAYYKEVTGQYFNGHGNQNAPGAVQFEAAAINHPALAGLPNPWQRNEEWYNFNSFQEWSTQPGFLVLGRKQADNQPIMWVREFGNWRSFYTALGHDAAVFRDPLVKQHLTGGILWAVRRDQSLL